MDIVELLQICKKHDIDICLSYSDSLKAYILRVVKGSTAIARALSDLDSIRNPSDCIRESIDYMLGSLEGDK